MKLQLPSRLATSLGALLTAIVVVTNELQMSHAVHQAIIAAGLLVGSWIVHPQEGAVAAVVGPPYDVGVTTPQPAVPAAPAPATVKSLP